MANEVLPNNISMEAIQREYERTMASNSIEKKNDGFDEKNYLNVRLGKGEKSKELRIRLLPVEANSSEIFAHVHTHNVEVPKEMVEAGKKPFKSYICLNSRLNGSQINSNVYGGKCPFCEENKKEYDASLSSKSEEERKMHVDRSLSFKPKESIIVRCIDRDHEDEGVKFWKFNLKYDKTDPYNMILNLVSKRNEESLKVRGIPNNILDLTTGRDLIITISQGNTENQLSYTIVESSYETPLSQNYQQALAWINDAKTWKDVFTVKTYDYLKLILDMKYPWFDRANQKWVDKEEFETSKKKAVAQATQEINEQINQAQQQYGAGGYVYQGNSAAPVNGYYNQNISQQGYGYQQGNYGYPTNPQGYMQ